ncbi:MAG: GGDEF domain-containing protein [Selenomonadaceae bacterium]|nr:GGDEF domain-containing protein [Selenomonadaceae bacterium]
MKLFYSLKHKVLAVCIAGMILMAICMGAISIWTISHLTHDYELQNMNHIVDKQTAAMDAELLRSENIVDYATNSVEREMKGLHLPVNAAFRQDMARLVDNDFQDAVPGLSLICSYYLYYPSENATAVWKADLAKDGTFQDVQEQFREQGSSLAPRHVKAFAYMTEQGKPVWLAPYYSATLARYVISYLCPVFQEGKMVAIVGVDLDFEEFMQEIYGDEPQNDNHGIMILSDGSGKMVYSPETPLGVPLEDKAIHLKSSTDEVKISGKTDAKMVSYQWDGQDSIASVSSLRNDMNLMDLRKVRQIYSRTHQAMAQMAVGLVLVCLLVSLLPLYMINRLSLRLQKIISAAQLVGQGHFDVDIHDDQPDDIGELSRNFQSMVEKVAASQQNLQYVSRHDSLTGILNRMGLDRAIQDWLLHHPDTPGALVSIDIDAFKFINDLHGHPAGDEALRTLARKLRAAFDENDIIGRNGGDEFVVFMKDASPEEVLDKVKAFSAQPKYFCFAGESHDFSVSIGYALYTGADMTLTKLFHQADTALYAVKLRGRNHYRVYEETMEKLNRTSLGFNLETITSNLPTALLVCEAAMEGKILFINKTMLELFECQNVHEFMAFTQGKQSHLICPCDRDRVRECVRVQLSDAHSQKVSSVVFCIRTLKGNMKQVYSIWRLADNANYGRVFYASIVESRLLAGATPDDSPCS